MRHLLCVVTLLAQTSWSMSQDNQFALRFYATGYNQEDRARFLIDDDLGPPTPDASRKSDIGEGDFSIDFWIKGTHAENPTGPARTPGDHFDYGWISGNIVLDRDIYGGGRGADHDFGMSLREGRVEFGTSTGEVDTSDHTLVGSIDVLDGDWNHITLTREVLTGIKRIYIDGVLDQESSPGVSLGDLSYFNEGVPNQVAPCGTGPWGPYLVIGTEKHDADWDSNGCNIPILFSYPGFRGRVDEVRLWSKTLSVEEIQDFHDRVINPLTPGLAAYWRFEEGSGTVLGDLVPQGSPGELIQGVLGNGEWTTDAPPLSSGRDSGISNWILY